MAYQYDMNTILRPGKVNRCLLSITGYYESDNNIYSSSVTLEWRPTYNLHIVCERQHYERVAQFEEVDPDHQVLAARDNP